jgi:hypothetical protein
MMTFISTGLNWLDIGFSCWIIGMFLIKHITVICSRVFMCREALYSLAYNLLKEQISKKSHCFKFRCKTLLHFITFKIKLSITVIGNKKFLIQKCCQSCYLQVLHFRKADELSTCVAYASDCTEP